MFSSKQAFLRSVATKHTDLKVLALRDKSEGTVYKVRNAKKSVTNKILNNFTAGPLLVG